MHISENNLARLMNHLDRLTIIKMHVFVTIANISPTKIQSN